MTISTPPLLLAQAKKPMVLYINMYMFKFPALYEVQYIKLKG